MRLLTAVFSFNRFHLLKNTLDSLFTLGPAGDVVIIDDGSDDPRTKDLLAGLEAKGAAKVIRKARGEGFHGGLYESMDIAVERAIAGGYSHLFFLQDDVQFMWKDARFAERVEKIFSVRRDAAMVFPLFQKRVIASAMGRRLEPFPDAGAWHLKPYGIADMGIMPVSLLQERGWKFGRSEGENSRAWADAGYKLYTLAAPTLAWVPWPEISVFGKPLVKDRAPRREFFLKPLSPSQIERLVSAGLSAVPYHEDYCAPWGWKCLSPYCFTRGVKEYVGCLIRERTWPTWVTAE